ncbi:MAG: hypothetical protein U9R00_03630 [Patescibacteria group bacterium]|nr:hypothetical protein [Patescibacteria group bacterium]
MALNARRSQDFVPIKDVRDGIIVLKDGGLRAVVIVSSINLALKEEDEQLAIINQFQSFLNGLDFHIEISIQSRKLDIRPYLLLLENRMKEQKEELIKIQTKEYADFIRSFTEEVSIMTKNFFVVVPYDQISIKETGSGITDKLKELGILKKKKGAEKGDLAKFEEKRSQLDQRVSVVISGLGNLGIRSSQLKTDEVVELFYKTFNPGDISQGIKL